MKKTHHLCGHPVNSEYRRGCRICRAAGMRRWRATHGESPETKQKQRVRRRAAYFLERGRLVPKPCEDCGDPDVEMHHPDYSKALEVVWLCRKHHLARHACERVAWAGKKKFLAAMDGRSFPQ